MSTEIWKFPLTVGAQTIDLPTHSRLLSVAAQGDDPVLWAVVVPSNAKTKRKIFVAMTGQSCDHELRGPFLGTVLLGGGNFVLHVFDHGE
jgi:hypothetical protein